MGGGGGSDVEDEDREEDGEDGAHVEAESVGHHRDQLPLDLRRCRPFHVAALSQGIDAQARRDA